ncbi:hypothetical protein [Massilia rubra]|uniref:Uncharacterized protein n=1 Tax=Massilia rubra TaxID=2607910 RepID=A0ABX0LXZ2_9BURK|nr:hypothetical protein [Massilia rubra]NHZ37200.1 hypothetical protein [Massilia rubra]
MTTQVRPHPLLKVQLVIKVVCFSLCQIMPWRAEAILPILGKYRIRPNRCVAAYQSASRPALKRFTDAHVARHVLAASTDSADDEGLFSIGTVPDRPGRARAGQKTKSPAALHAAGLFKAYPD